MFSLELYVDVLIARAYQFGTSAFCVRTVYGRLSEDHRRCMRSPVPRCVVLFQSQLNI